MDEWPLVGRERELEAVAEALERPDSGGVVFVGSAGVGKTRLLTECRRVAEGAGFASVRVTPTRTSAGIPFGAVAPFLPASEEPASEARLLRGAVHAIGEAAGGRPLMVIVDDAHLLDDGSATVIGQLAAEQRAFVAAAVRSGESTPDAVVGLWKEGNARRIDLEPFAPATFATLVDRALGGHAESATSWLLWQQTGGNPLFLREVLLAATTAGALHKRDGIWQLVPGPVTSTRLVELVEQRLAGLESDHRRALTLVAFGEPVEVGIVEGVCGVDAIEALERQNLIVVEAHGGRVEVRLAHHLYGEALRSGTSLLQARAARKSLIDAVRAAGSRRRDDDLRLAGWTLDNGDPLDPALALDAARAAAAAFAFALAERFARHALVAGGGLDAGLLLSEVLTNQGKYAEAESVLGAVEGDVGTDEQVIALALNRAGLLHAAGRREESYAIHLSAIGRVENPSTRDQSICLLAWHELLDGDPATALARLEPLLEGPVSPATVRATLISGLALPLLGRTREALALRDRQMERHRELHAAPPIAPPVVHSIFHSLTLCFTGRPAAALAIIEAAHRVSIEEGQARMQALAATELARAHLFLGNMVAAARFGREGAFLTGELGRASTGRWSLTLVSLAEAMSGDAAAATEALVAAEQLMRGEQKLMDAEVDRARGWVAAATGDRAGAQKSFVAAAARAATSGELVLEVLALHDLARLGDAEAAAARLIELAGVVDGALAVACAADAAARRDHDPAALEAAAATFESMDLWVHAAESLLAAADAWKQASDSRAEAACVRRARAAVRNCPGAATPALAALTPRSDATLTAGEREVAEMAAGGLASRVIADRLYLSVRTVENRLQRVYRKLGLRDRSLLAEALRDHESS